VSELATAPVKPEIRNMLLNAGFVDILFSNNTPYWVAIAWKK
jgi:hypothetical protein